MRSCIVATRSWACARRRFDLRPAMTRNHPLLARAAPPRCARAPARIAAPFLRSFHRDPRRGVGIGPLAGHPPPLRRPPLAWPRARGARGSRRGPQRRGCGRGAQRCAGSGRAAPPASGSGRAAPPASAASSRWQRAARRSRRGTAAWPGSLLNANVRSACLTAGRSEPASRRTDGHAVKASPALTGGSDSVARDQIFVVSSAHRPARANCTTGAGAWAPYERSGRDSQ
jgi:hypothetical protein